MTGQEYPTREQAAAEVKRVTQAFGGPAMDEFMNDPPTRKQYAIADAVLALFPQPTPSEVEVEGSFFAVADLPDILARHMRALDDAHRREKQHWIEQHEQPLTPEQRRERMCRCTPEPVLPATETPSIADMAPGTTFTACWRGHETPDQFVRLNDGVRCIAPGRWYSGIATEVRYTADRIEQSTIRDVTPPPAPGGKQ